MSAVVVVRDVAIARQSLLDVKQNREGEKSYKKKMGALVEFDKAVESAIEYAKLNVPTEHVVSALVAERDLVAEKFTGLYTTQLTGMQKLVEKVDAIRAKSELQLPWATDDSPSKEAILAVVNSTQAEELKAAWQPLVTQQASLTFLIESFPADSRPSVEIAVKATNDKFPYAEIENKYIQCRDHVCEMMISRAIFRPKKDKETRKDAVDKTLAYVKILGGEIDLKIKLFADQASITDS